MAAGPESQDLIMESIELYLIILKIQIYFVVYFNFILNVEWFTLNCVIMSCR